MRYLALFFVLACGGGKPAVESPRPTAAPVAASSPCASAYADYEQRWRTARSADLVEVGFDAASVDEVLAIEVALLPNKTDLAKLRGQYTAVAVFLPDSPWPRALDAADAAIEQCGEEAPHP